MDYENPTTTWTDELLHQHISGDRSPKLILALQDDDSGFCKKKIRDPLSHRIIEKRRRDRMNSCLTDLSKLIPVAHLRTGHGRIEKTEIIEMAIKHLRHLQANVDAAQLNERRKFPSSVEQGPNYLHHFQNGYQECTSEIMRFLVEVEGFYAGDTLCVRLLAHLRKHYNKLMQDLFANKMKQELPSITTDKDDDIADKIPPIHDNCSKTYDANSCYTGKEKETKPALHLLESRKPVNALFKSFDAQITGVSSDKHVKHEPTTRSANSPKEPCKGYLHQDSVQKSRPVSAASSSSSTRSDETYKYKNNIKDRFNADLQHHPQCSSESDFRCDAFAGKREPRTSTVNETVDGSLRQNQHSSNSPEPFDHLKNYVVSPSADPGRKNSAQHKCVQNLLPGALSLGRLPMFVLHPNRNFYVPMTIASSIIDSISTKSNGHFPHLHSVNISVYFGNTGDVPESAFRLM